MILNRIRSNLVNGGLARSQVFAKLQSGTKNSLALEVKSFQHLLIPLAKILPKFALPLTLLKYIDAQTHMTWPATSLFWMFCFAKFI